MKLLRRRAPLSDVASTEPPIGSEIASPERDEVTSGDGRRVGDRRGDDRRGECKEGRLRRGPDRRHADRRVEQQQPQQPPQQQNRHRIRETFFTIFWLAQVLVIAWFVWPTQLGGRTSYAIVSGHSMDPTFHTGDMVVTRVASSYRAGQVVVYRVPDSTIPGHLRVIHRLKKESADGTFTVQGDNNPSEDPWYPAPSDIIGKQVFLIPKVVQAVDMMLRPQVLAVIFGVSVLWYMWPDEDEDEDEDDDDDDVDVEDEDEDDGNSTEGDGDGQTEEGNEEQDVALPLTASGGRFRLRKTA